MISAQTRSRLELLFSFVAPLAIVAVLLTAGLGDFGMWEPYESQHIARGAAVASTGASSLGDALSSAGSAWRGHRELGARLPSAALAFVAALALGFTALSLGGKRFSLFALLALAGAPVFLFHGRQATGGAPLLAAETLAFAGLSLFAFGEGRLTAIAGVAAAALGIPFATVCGGAILGISVPAGAIAVALSIAGLGQGLRRKSALAVSSLLCLGGVAIFSLAVALEWDLPAITAGLAAKPAAVDCTAALGQIAYGWYPWSALLVLLFALPASDADGGPRRKTIRALAVSGIAFGVVGQTFFTALHGPSPLFLAVPVAFGVAVVLEELERSELPQRFAALAVAAAAMIMARDFAQQPAMLLTGYALPSLKTPEVFKPFIHTLIATAPFLLLAGTAGVFRGGEGVVRRLRVRALMPVAALVFGGFIALDLVPELSVHFSPKHAAQAYEQFAKKGEPLAVYGAPSPVPNGKVLESRSALVAWLSRPDRVFALLPPRELPLVDKEYRAARGAHVYVLDMASTRLILATSKPKAGESDVNPIARDVFSAPFPTPPSHATQVNFGDKLTLLGWEVESPAGRGALKRGADFTLTTYWHCAAPLQTAYRMFVHIDGKGPRISGDHDPLSGAYPTLHWNAGDYIRDIYHGSIPAVQESGAYTIRTGLYRGDTRLPIVGEPSAQENSLLLGTVPLK
jgi:hypothetical protein